MKKLAAAVLGLFLLIVTGDVLFLYNIDQDNNYRMFYFILNNSVVAVFSFLLFIMLVRYHNKREKESFKKMFMENYAVELIIEPVT